jgi:osmotically-inducible protein OsmY
MTARRATLYGVVVALALAVAPAARSAEAPDAWITAKVKFALLTADGLGAFDVNVDTLDGRVTLHGRAPSAADAAQAERLAREVSGVREVRNLIQVVPPDARAALEENDDAIERRAEAALASSPAFANVDVTSVDAGVVVLGGRTDTLSAHVDALRAVREVDGVRRVVSQIQSPDRLADAELWRDETGAPARNATRAVQDMWITTAAKLDLLTEEAPAFDIHVDTRNGVVTLFGTVASEAEKQAAAASVRAIDGVRDVRNELQVVPPARQDAVARQDDEIEAELEKRIEDRSDLADARIDVEVENGVARLTGKVQSQTDRLSALTMARTTQGVRSVMGELEVVRN